MGNNHKNNRRNGRENGSYTSPDIPPLVLLSYAIENNRTLVRLTALTTITSCLVIALFPLAYPNLAQEMHEAKLANTPIDINTVTAEVAPGNKAVIIDATSSWNTTTKGANWSHLANSPPMQILLIDKQQMARDEQRMVDYAANTLQIDDRFLATTESDRWTVQVPTIPHNFAEFSQEEQVRYQGLIAANISGQIYYCAHHDHNSAHYYQQVLDNVLPPLVAITPQQ